ncbi:hypothetical protein D3C72_1721750 [compost metagenome]
MRKLLILGGVPVLPVGVLRRRVCSSASVKSEANQPVADTPSISLVVLRSANSEWLLMSVMSVISGEPSATRVPSLLMTRSTEMKSALCVKA